MHHFALLISMPGGIEWILLFFGLPLYFLPSIIAGTRHHPNITSIVLLNIFLGWTFLGWIGALIWAFSSGAKSNPAVIVNNSSQSYSQAEKPDFSHQTQPAGSVKQSTTHQDKIDQLREFKQLLDEGVITIEEFNKQKASILGE